MQWLFKYPSILVWADKIVIPESIWSTISSEAGRSNLKENTKPLSGSVSI
jgi:hypothetical protein